MQICPPLVIKTKRFAFGLHSGNALMLLQENLCRLTEQVVVVPSYRLCSKGCEIMKKDTSLPRMGNYKHLIETQGVCKKDTLVHRCNM